MAQAKEPSAAGQQGSTHSTAANAQPGRQRGLSRREDFLPWTDSPFALMRRFSEEMDRVFGGNLLTDFGMERRSPVARGSRGVGLSPAQWAPSIEVFERDNQLVIRADLPGLSKDDVNIELTDDVLTIAGERREEREETREDYRHSERRYGRFSRSIPLPTGVDAENVKATFQNGVLEVTMPAPQREQRGRKIEIQEASGGKAQTSDDQSATAS